MDPTRVTEGVVISDPDDIATMVCANSSFDYPVLSYPQMTLCMYMRKRAEQRKHIDPPITDRSCIGVIGLVISVKLRGGTGRPVPLTLPPLTLPRMHYAEDTTWM